MSKILIIDDERSIRNTLKEILEYEKFSVDDAEDGLKGIEKIKAGKYDLILCDIKMPGKDGLEVLEFALEQAPETPFIVISGHGTIETAVDAVKKGAFDFISKPLDLNRLLLTVRNGLDKQELIAETKTLRKKINKKLGTHIIGESDEVKELIRIIDKVAPTDARVMITGQNGTGKELVARSMHEKSERGKGPFVEVNCAAIPSELIESELFGHEKGAFTSAIKQKKGKFELAQGGTLFLDEIGDMSASAQAKVLRALQENKINRVGGDKDIKVDVRIIAATNKDLKKEIDEGNFREDLYHRIGVIPIHVPSLNERAKDIPVLAHHFMQEICEEQGIPPKTITKQADTALSKVQWTGNVRELKNAMERLIILCDQKIDAEDVKRYVGFTNAMG